MKTGTDIT